MASGFSVDLDALKKAGLSTADLMAILSRTTVDEVDCAPAAVGDNTLASQLESFCSRWQVGVDNLTKDGQQLAQHLIDSAGTYLEAEQQVIRLLGERPDTIEPPPQPPPASASGRGPRPARGGHVVAAHDLGETNDPRALVPGDPGAVMASAKGLSRFGRLLSDTGDGLKRLDSGGWTGQAGDAFRAYFDGEPGRWVKAGDAFSNATSALETYAHSLRSAQEQARDAIELWTKGEAATEQARARQASEAHNQASLASAGASAMPSDPGEPLRNQAQEKLDRAREQLRGAGAEAATSLDQAQQSAPEERNLVEQAWDAATTAASAAWEGVTDGAAWAVRGFGEGVGDSIGAIFDGAGDAASSIPTVSGAVAGGVLESLGFDEQGKAIRQQGIEDGRQWDAAWDGMGTRLEEGITDATDAVGDWIAGEDDDQGHYVLIDPHRHPETANHVLQAQEGYSWDGDTQRPGWNPQPKDLTIDRDGADERREEAMKQVPQTRSGFDRDEYPPALFEEGGDGASVKYIDPSDNQGAGSSMRRQIAGQGLGDGDQVRIVVG